MPGIKWQNQIQIGSEATAGTPATATARWRGLGGFPDDQREIVFPEEHIGSLPGKDRSYTPKLAAEVVFPDTEATFEQLAYLLSSAIEDEDAGVQDGAGSGYIREYSVPTSTPPEVTGIKTRTLYGGDNKAQEKVEYCFVRELTLKGRATEAVMMSAVWAGRQVQSGSFETLAKPSVKELLTSKGKLYIDNAGGTIGSTQVTEQLIEFELKLASGWIVRHTADGELFFTKAIFTRPVIDLSLTFDHDADAIAEKANWRNEVARLIRLEFTGPALATGGTLYSDKLLRMDLAGKWATFEMPAEDEGVNTVKANFKALENDTAALYAVITLVNELATLP